jgi:hypothetical protein
MPPGELRHQNTEALQRYFAEHTPKLLRPAAGILKYPSIAPSLPGKECATQLWDWDTLWTSRGLNDTYVDIREGQVLPNTITPEPQSEA